MTSVSEAKSKMLWAGILSVAILIVLTALAALGYSKLEDSGLVVYVMAVPIFMTGLAFALGYIDTNEDMDEEEIKYMLRRTFIFGGVMFIITLLAAIVLCLS